MPSNRSNNEIGKAFAIGTKIEYMNKLYEVTESGSCADCSLGSICSSNDKSSNIKGDLLREEKIKIFGECSSIKRPDGKSVVFVEIPKDDSKDNSKHDYYKISPLWVYNNPTQLRPIELVLPNGHEIDVESSDLSKGIIRFRRKWLTIEQLYKLAKENNHVTQRDSIKHFSDSKLVALAYLMDIAKYFNGYWEYNITKGDVGYAIAYYKFVEEPHYSVCKIENSVYTYYGNPVFKNEADAQYVIDNPNFRDVLDMIFKL